MPNPLENQEKYFIPRTPEKPAAEPERRQKSPVLEHQTRVVDIAALKAKRERETEEKIEAIRRKLGVEVKTKEQIPASPDFVRREPARFAADGAFSVFSSDPSVPQELIRPVFVEQGQEKVGGGSRLEVKQTPSMGKAGFVERPLQVDGIDYRFVQWKGIGSNEVNQAQEKAMRQMGGKWDYPLGRHGAIPLFFAEFRGKRLLRFQGAAFYEDLLTEAEKTKQFESTGLRMPKILATMKFSREFCLKNDLPVPDSDDPQSVTGETLRSFLEDRRQKMDPKQFEDVSGAADVDSGYTSAVLGENVRAFRNVWRVDDIEQVLREPASKQQQEKLQNIIDASRDILSKEIGISIDRKTFPNVFAKLLGEQAAILVRNEIIQGAMMNHKQDVTLAAEICDFDGAVRLDDASLDAPENMPKWVKDEETKKMWKESLSLRMDRQVLLLASHAIPCVEAVRFLEGSSVSQPEIAAAFVDSFVQSLPIERRRELKTRIERQAAFGSIEDIGGKDEQTLKNFAGYQGFFDAVVAALKEKL